MQPVETILFWSVAGGLKYRYFTVAPADTLGPRPLEIVAVFVALALVGVLWGIVEVRRGRGSVVRGDSQDTCREYTRSGTGVNVSAAMWRR